MCCEIRKFPKMVSYLWIVFMLFLHNRAEEFQISSNNLISIFNNIDCIEASAILEKGTFTENYDLYEKIPLNMSNINKNSKSLLTTIHELAQYNKITYNYVLISEDGPPHSKVYRVVLNLGDEQYEGEGSSLKKAQNNAAKQATDHTSYTIPPEKFTINQQKQTPTVILNNIATKLGIKVSYHLDDKNLIAIDSNKIKINYNQKLNLSNIDDDDDGLSIEDEQITGPFVIKLIFDNQEYLGYGQTIQAARHNAAIKALDFITKQTAYQQHICNLDESDENCRQKRETLKSPISRLYELVQQHQYRIEFNVIEEHGKEHRKKFVTQCRINNDEFVTIGEGNSKKESKRIAAEYMLEELSNFQTINTNEIVNRFQSIEKKKKKKNKTKKLLKNHQNIIQTTLDDILNSIFINDKNIPKQNNKFTPKQKLLEIANKLEFDIKFHNLGKNGDNFYTIVSLGIRPPYVCLGEAKTEDGSIKNAAINGLKFLKKTDIFENLSNDNKLNSIEIDLMIDNDQLPDYNIEES